MKLGSGLSSTSHEPGQSISRWSPYFNFLICKPGEMSPVPKVVLNNGNVYAESLARCPPHLSALPCSAAEPASSVTGSAWWPGEEAHSPNMGFQPTPCTASRARQVQAAKGSPSRSRLCSHSLHACACVHTHTHAHTQSPQQRHLSEAHQCSMSATHRAELSVNVQRGAQARVRAKRKGARNHSPRLSWGGQWRGAGRCHHAQERGYRMKQKTSNGLKTKRRENTALVKKQTRVAGWAPTPLPRSS